MKRIVSLMLMLVLVISVICILPVSSNAAVFDDTQMYIVDEDDCSVDSSAFVGNTVSLMWRSKDNVVFYEVYCRVFQDYGNGYNTGWVRILPYVENVNGNESIHASVPIKDKMMAGIACKNDAVGQDVTIDFCIIGIFDENIELEDNYSSDKLAPSTGMLYSDSESFVPSLVVENSDTDTVSDAITLAPSASRFDFSISRPYNYFSESVITNYWFFVASKNGDWLPLYSFSADKDGDVLYVSVSLSTLKTYADSNNCIRITVRGKSGDDFVTPYYGGHEGGYTLRFE